MLIKWRTPMKHHHILSVSALLVSTVMILAGCIFFKNSHIVRLPRSSNNGINELNPGTEMTLESKRENITDMCDFLKASYKKMQELAATDDASPNGKQAAKAVETEYADRLNELFALDFSTMDEAEIDSCLIEMTNLITAIREARDALTLG